MIECKFSLNLSKNGVQKTVYAKAGESKARMLIITLSHNGKVYELEGHSAMVFLESGENFLADIVDNTVQAVIPNAFPEPQVRVCELRISKGDKVIYTPMFEIVFEVSLGNIAETESLVDGVKYIIKAEHDREDSHSISMVANLRDTLDSKASAETVTAHYNEFNKAFSDRDAVLDAYVKKTDGAITNLNSDMNLLKETSHSHSNKSALDLISDVNGEFYYNGKEVSGMSNLQKTQLKEAYDSKHSHIDLNGKDNLYVLECFSEGDDTRPYYLEKPLAFYDEIPSKTSHLENDSGFITKDDLPESGSVARPMAQEEYTKDDNVVDLFFDGDNDIIWGIFWNEPTIPVGTEIADIELIVNKVNTEYVSIKELYTIDGVPTHSMVNKVVFNEDMGYTFMAIYVPTGKNLFSSAITAGQNFSVLITYYTD